MTDAPATVTPNYTVDCDEPQNLDQQSYFNEKAAFPPIAEQEEIAGFLDAECAGIDRLISKSAEMIDTLREYRSALITNAVTGKIDVRGVV